MKQRTNRKGSMGRKRTRTAYLLLTPVLLAYMWAVVIPVVLVCYLGFTKYNIIQPAQWVGLTNYVKLLFEDSIFRESLYNTIRFVVMSVLPGVGVGLLVALILNAKLRAKGILRSATYLPYVIPIMGVSFIWIYLYDPARQGVFNYYLSFVGISPLNWLRDSRWALMAIVIMTIWRTLGYYAIMFLAGLQGIPGVYYEAAKLDGASKWQVFRYITAPLLKPVVSLVIIIAAMNSFQIFQEPYIMTEGGPGVSTMTLVYRMYALGFKSLKMGEGSAVSVILGLIIFVFAVLYLRGFRSSNQ